MGLELLGVGLPALTAALGAAYSAWTTRRMASREARRIDLLAADIKARLAQELRNRPGSKADQRSPLSPGLSPDVAALLENSLEKQIEQIPSTRPSSAA
jgi:hypothetical protein